MEPAEMLKPWMKEDLANHRLNFDNIPEPITVALKKNDKESLIQLLGGILEAEILLHIWRRDFV